MKHYILALFTLALALGVLVHFILVAILGPILIQEPSRLWLSAEIALISVIVIYSLWSLVGILRKERRSRHENSPD